MLRATVVRSVRPAAAAAVASAAPRPVATAAAARASALLRQQARSAAAGRLASSSTPVVRCEAPSATPPEKEELTVLSDQKELLPVPPHVEKLVDEIAALNMVEMMAFCQSFTGKLGLTWEQVLSMQGGGGGGGAAPVAAAAAAPAEEAAEPVPEAKSAYNVVLKELGDGKKYAVLKEIRNLKPGMTIGESKKFVEELPSVVGEGMPKDEAEKWVAALNAAGGTTVLD